MGREVNPWESFYSDKLTFGRCNEYHEAEKNIQSYSAPNIPNTKEGEFVEAELVWQLFDHDREQWQDGDQSPECTWEKFQSFYRTTRQIWKLTKVKEIESVEQAAEAKYPVKADSLSGPVANERARFKALGMQNAFKAGAKWREENPVRK